MRKILSVVALSVVAATIPSAVMASAAASTTLAGAVQTPAHVTGISHNKVTSSNWGGYSVADASKFTDIKASWKEPTAKSTTSSAEYAAFWVGIDGYSSNSVEQLGTDSDCHGVGKPSYYAWYEMYPASSVSISTSKYPVKPGDTLTAEVMRSGLSYTLSITSSRGWSFSITKTGSSTLKDSSAEWIAESPEICGSTCKLAKLADFGKVAFTNAEAAVGGSDMPISSFTADSGPHEITCKAGSTVRMSPSALSSSGDSFTMTWKHD